jgi:adenylosuccinate lyase
MEGHSMLARTDNQPLLPVWVKKLVFFVERLEEQMRLLFNIPFAAKFGGEQDWNAHHVAYQIRLEKIWRKFVEEH